MPKTTRPARFGAQLCAGELEVTARRERSLKVAAELQPVTQAVVGLERHVQRVGGIMDQVIVDVDL